MSKLWRYLQDPDCVFAERFGDLASVRNRHTVTGNPTICNSPYGKALVLDGTNDYLTLSGAREAALRFDAGTDDFSIVMIARPDSADATYLFSKEDAADDGWVLYTTGLASVGLCIGHSPNYSYTAEASFVTGAWHVIVGSVDRDASNTLYINGAQSGTTDNPSSEVIATTVTPRIGATAYDGTGKFAGAIHSVIIFSRALSATEALSISTGRAF